jgi:hypothetical protein
MRSHSESAEQRGTEGTRPMRPLMVCALSLTGIIAACSRAPAPQAQGDQPVLVHTPPIKQLDLKQLKALSIECEKYLPGQFARGPYDAAYCQAAIDAWGDAPLQMVRIPAASPHAN